MGGFFSRLWSSIFGKTWIQILMVGLDAAGKTTILYNFKLGEVIQTAPTIGFNVESVDYKNINFKIWDACSQEKIRPLWLYYLQNMKVAEEFSLVFVVDSADRERIEEASKELKILSVQDLLRNVPILILANKQDLPNAMSTDEIIEKMELKPILENHVWHIQPTSAFSGQGLYEGLDWLSNKIALK